MKLSLALPDPIDIEVSIAGGSPVTYRIRPASRDQVRRALALDPEEDEFDPLKLACIRADQAAILAEQSGQLSEISGEVNWKNKLPCQLLTGEQNAQLCRVLLHWHLGQDPVQAEAIHGVKKNAALMRKLIASAPGLGSDLTATLSALLAISKPPSPPPEPSATLSPS